METLTLEAEIVKGWGAGNPGSGGVPAAPSARPGTPGRWFPFLVYLYITSLNMTKKSVGTVEKWSKRKSKSDRQRKFSDKYMLGRDKKAAESLF